MKHPEGPLLTVASTAALVFCLISHERTPSPTAEQSVANVKPFEYVGTSGKTTVSYCGGLSIKAAGWNATDKTVRLSVKPKLAEGLHLTGTRIEGVATGVTGDTFDDSSIILFKAKPSEVFAHQSANVTVSTEKREKTLIQASVTEGINGGSLNMTYEPKGEKNEVHSSITGYDNLCPSSYVVADIETHTLTITPKVDWLN